MQNETKVETHGLWPEGAGPPVRINRARINATRGTGQSASVREELHCSNTLRHLDRGFPFFDHHRKTRR